MQLEEFVHFCCLFCESVSVGGGKAEPVCSAEGLSMNSGLGKKTWWSLPPHSLGTITCDLFCPGGTWPNVATPKIATAAGSGYIREHPHTQSLSISRVGVLGASVHAGKEVQAALVLSEKYPGNSDTLSCSFSILMLMDISCFSLH